MEVICSFFLHRSFACTLFLFSALILSQVVLIFGQIQHCESSTPSDAKSDAALEIHACKVLPKTPLEKNVKMSSSSAVVPYDESTLPLFHKPVREFHIAGQKIVVKQNWKELGVAAVVWDAVSQTST